MSLKKADKTAVKKKRKEKKETTMIDFKKVWWGLFVSRFYSIHDPPTQ